MSHALRGEAWELAREASTSIVDPGGSRAGEGGQPAGDPERRLPQATLTGSLPTGNVVNGMIARQMVDMLVESSSNVEMILKFFDMFLKLKDIVGSEAFQDYVTDPRGLISKKDFQKVGAGRQVGGVPNGKRLLCGPQLRYL